MRRASLARLLLLLPFALGAWLALRAKAPSSAPPPRAAIVAQAEPAAPVTPATQPPEQAAPDHAASKAAPTTQVAPLSESSLMTELRAIKDQNPALAEQLARQGNELFPNSPDAPERTAILIHALSALARPMEARGEAEQMVNRFPDSAWVREIEAFTGAHRHRNGHMNADGQLVFD